MDKIKAKVKIVCRCERMLFGSLQRSGSKGAKGTLYGWLLYLILIPLCTVFGFSHPALSGAENYRLGWGEKIFSIYNLDMQMCWAVGTDGLMLKTVDGGKTWERRKRVTTLPLDDIFFIKNKGWIVGERGLLLKTEDGGSTWKQHPQLTDLALFKLFFINENQGVAVGEGGTILYTENGGSLWQPYPVDWLTVLPESLISAGVLAPALFDVFFLDSSHGWIVGDRGIVLKTSDGGKQWEISRVGFFSPLYDVFFKNESEGWAVGQNGTIIYSQDGGKSWVELKTPVKFSLFKIRLFDDTYGLIVGAGGTVLETLDGGLTWSSLKVDLAPPFPFFADVWLVSRNPQMKIILLGERIVTTSIQRSPN